MSDVFIPFNNEPVSTQIGNWTSTYTCPAGKYARVRVQCSGYAVGLPGFTSSATGGDISFCTSDSFAMSFDLWLKAAETVSGSITAASASTGATARGAVSSTSSVAVSKNGSTVANLFCAATAGHSIAVSTSTSTVSGSASFYWVAEEFYSLT